MASDISDILNLGAGGHETPLTEKKKKPKKPRGMARELWGLLWKDDMVEAPVVPSEATEGYKQMKAKIGISKVRSWRWVAFTNPARKDGAVFYHWRRENEELKEYPFASFNKTPDIPMYTDLEYQQHLHNESWTRAETDHLFELCTRFDLRFYVIQDRWGEEFKERPLEELKDRFYTMSNTLAKIRAVAGGEPPKLKLYDGENEKRRKEQLVAMYQRSKEDLEEEQALAVELKKMESRKRERERKTQDLQNLISAADDHKGISAGAAAPGVGRGRIGDNRKIKKRKLQTSAAGIASSIARREFSMPFSGTYGAAASSGIKFPEPRPVGVSLRSMRMKLPATLGQKKTKAIEQVLEELVIDPTPIPTEEICLAFNELRQDIVLLYELKTALSVCQHDLEEAKCQLESISPERLARLHIPAGILVKKEPGVAEEEGTSGGGRLCESIDVSHGGRKRKAAVEQSNLLKKMKQKH